MPLGELRHFPVVPRPLALLQPLEVERAVPSDARSIAGVLRCNADVPTLVLQAPGRIRRHIDEFMVIRGTQRAVLACAQLRWHRPHVAELMSVAVHPSRQRQGLGRAVVRASIERAMRSNPRLVWLTTNRPAWLERLGFEPIPVGSIPPRVLLGRLGLVTRQPWNRWPGALLGPQVLMRWSGGW